MSNMGNREGGDSGPGDKRDYIGNIPTRTLRWVPKYRFKVVIENFDEEEIYRSDIESDNKRIIISMDSDHFQVMETTPRVQ